MRKNVLPSLFLMISGGFLFFSCAGSPDISVVPPLIPANVPVRSEDPPSESDISAEQPEPLKKSTWTEASKQSNWLERMDQPEESTRPERTMRPEEKETSEQKALFELTTARPERTVPPVPEMIVNPNLNRPLLGRGQTDAEKLAAFLLMVNSNADPKFVRQLSRIYVEEAALEGIDHDVAFAQMCLETGFLRFGGLVTFDMNNFCGLGSTGPGVPGERFPSPQIGVRAQIQHLKGYATEVPPSQELVDPRYKYVRYGSAPTIKGLAGTWAADLRYAEKIASVLQRMYAISNITTGSNAADSDTDDAAIAAGQGDKSPD
jgi:flagellum-specific peptidoglycan hydrolase FlgJ